MGNGELGPVQGFKVGQTPLQCAIMDGVSANNLSMLSRLHVTLSAWIISDADVIVVDALSPLCWYWPKKSNRFQIIIFMMTILDPPDLLLPEA